MTTLLDLPNEVLSRIAERLSDADHKALFSLIYVNKRLNIITTPFLVRRWPPVERDALEHSPGYDRFVLHLLRNPTLRRYISLLDAGDFSTREDRDDVETAVSRDELEEIATAGLRDWPALAELSEWREQISEGIQDAFVVLILLWARDLVEFDFTVPLIGLIRLDGEEQLTLGFVSQVARMFSGSSEGAILDHLPLAKLQSVQYKHGDTEFGVQGKYAAPFFYLPNLRTFFGFRIEMAPSHIEESFEDGDGDQSTYLTEFPVGTSTVEEIILNTSDVCLEGLTTLVRACRRLRTFALHYGPVLDTREVDSSRLAELLLARADSLQNLALDWGESPTLEITAQGPLKIEQCFHQLHRLEYLELALYMLCEESEIDGQAFISLNSQLLPKSLRCLCLVGNADWRLKNEVALTKLVDSIEAFMLKCGPGGEFPHMEALELIYLTYRPPTYNYTQRLEETGRRKNLRVIFNKYQWRTWPGYG
ncbi:unnamed protein product [Clonostachys solani]|uniref:F-box domain-containing protein n=1 Tax=Clonostachys solani TaxID=160281 RepID=A0A9N9W154_9HYPO|nr:unnamed protein product [Clonostachys solani]